MRVRTITDPNVDIGAERGMCLKYVDDGVNATLRQPSAKASFDVENSNGNIRTYQFPVGVWVPGYLAFTKGAYVDLGHVFWAYNHGDKVEIHDSEVHSGARKPYNSLAELLAWFGAYKPAFIGWSLWLDGVQVAEEFEDPTPETPVAEPDLKGLTHTVVEGDTLSQIILDEGWGTPETLYGPDGDVARIAAANGIENPDLIYPNQVIRKA